ncbi:M23 family metallopeptidase [Xanthobacter oligotrophicus]|uniref:M23 family metallopeptidase n=1 Tax=Xanthobacter oligotrophicus TaxID=2607286 RepID=UPI0011F11980|nr:M23 family metallopeptidase [Xanthobacter oligotrophicus]MCG5233910.1 M23 family metallopeptidase [Xanthobacter oligotrophicus]
MHRLLVALAALAAASPAFAQSLKTDEVYSSIAAQPITAPNPVLGADGRVHLAYELYVTNPSKLFVTLDKVEAVDGGGHALSSLEGEGLRAMLTDYAGAGRTLPPGGTAAVFLDVPFAREAKLPERVFARVTATRQEAGPDGKPAPMPADAPLPATYSFTGAETAIGRPAVVIAPPLRGKGWVAINGCCDALTSHRGAIMAINGRLRVPERFAIDFVQLDASDRLFTGDVHKLESYAFYGVPVHAVADGVVVNLYDATDAQVPGGDAKGITPENIGGNMLVIDMGGGNFAFYAHMQRGSLKVKLGDKVRTGDVIGLLGNTGNTNAPHLHFHVMDGPSPLDSNGLPYAFTRFEGQGVANPAGADFFEKPVPADIDRTRLAGPRQDALPLNNEVVDFGDGK